MKLRSGSWIETGFEDTVEPTSFARAKCSLWPERPSVSTNVQYNTKCNYSYSDLVRRVLHLNAITSCFQPSADRIQTRSSSRQGFPLKNESSSSQSS